MVKQYQHGDDLMTFAVVALFDKKTKTIKTMFMEYGRTM